MNLTRRRLYGDQNGGGDSSTGDHIAGKADSNHWVMMDGPHEFGGSAAATRPKELVLLALGGCTGSDVVTILRRSEWPSMAWRSTCQLTRLKNIQSATHGSTSSTLVSGHDIAARDVERAIELSETKYLLGERDVDEQRVHHALLPDRGDGGDRGARVSELLAPAGLIVAWLLLQLWVLPRLGVST